MAKMTMKQFEKSKYDVEKKGEKEGSKADIALDKKQLKAVNAKRGMARGGGVEAKGKTKGKSMACGGKVKK